MLPGASAVSASNGCFSAAGGEAPFAGIAFAVFCPAESPSEHPAIAKIESINTTKIIETDLSNFIDNCLQTKSGRS